jgi:hypothetical protein
VTSNERSERRKERLARNEALFREVNERVEEISEGAPRLDSIDFICECGDADCTQAIPLTRPEYEQLRADPLHFAVVPGHAIPDIEEVVFNDGDRVQVVRKHEDEELIARVTDPRS